MSRKVAPAPVLCPKTGKPLCLSMQDAPPPWVADGVRLKVKATPNTRINTRGSRGLAVHVPSWGDKHDCAAFAGEACVVWTLDEPRSLVARGGFIIEGTGADRRVSRIAPGLPTRALSLSSDGAQVFSDLSYDMWAARREGGVAGYRAALDAVQRTAAFHRLAVELDDTPQFTCGHCGETVRPHRKHCAGAREGSRAEDMPPCKLVLRIAVDLERAPAESGTASTRDAHVPALDTVFNAFDMIAHAIKGMK